MEYVMNDLEKQLYKMIEQDGIKAALQPTIRALMEYAHTMSDMGIKERSHRAIDIAGILKDIRDNLEE